VFRKRTMNIREFAKPITSKALNESLAKTFGQKINLDAFTTEQLEDVRNKLRTKVFAMEQELPFDSLHKNTNYQKNKLFIDTIHAALAEREENTGKVVETKITEGEEDKAELVMAAKIWLTVLLVGWKTPRKCKQTQCYN